MLYDIPGKGPLEIKTIILDLNGTLSVGGNIVDGSDKLLAKLKEAGFRIVLFTGNTRNDADQICQQLGIEWRLAKNAEDKQHLAHEFESSSCVSIGNGLIDLQLMKAVALRIVTLQAEGVHVQTMLNSDIIVPSFIDALELLLDPQRLIATLRT